MAIGPVQLIVLGFQNPQFHGEIIAELERLRESGTVRVIDALAVHKDADGEVEVAHLSNLTDDEAREIGSVVGALIGLGIDGDAGFVAGAEAGEEAAAEGIHVFSDEDAWDVLEDIPNDSAAALLLIEHHWAVPLRDAVVKAGGFRHQRRVHQPAGPGGHRSGDGRGGQGAARHGDSRRRNLTHHHYDIWREERCSDPAGSHGVLAGAPPDASTAATSSSTNGLPAPTSSRALYPPRPNSWARWTAWLREETPSFR